MSASGGRLRGGLIVVLLVLAALGGRLVWLQGGGSAQAAVWAERGEAQRLDTTVLRAPRGSILDRDGQPLAMTVEGRAVTANPRLLAGADCSLPGESPCTAAEVAAALAPVLGRPADDLTERLSRDSGFVYLARDLDPAVGEAVRGMRLPGIGVEDEARREHPGGDLAASVLGFTDREGTGAGGVELGWQDVLAGTDGSLTAESDRAGRVIPTGEQQRTPPVPGQDVQLTIDRDLQWHAQQVVAEQVAATGAESGSVVVLDVQTGEVLALATAPTFDAGAPGAAPEEDRGNRALSEVYEPGSVSKVVTTAIALENGTVTPDSVFSVPDRITVAGREIQDSHDHPVEQLTTSGILVTSSNVGTVQIAQQLGPQALYDGLRRFGFGERSGLGLPGESRGILAEPADWSGTSLATISFGQGVSGNAVQVASVYQTIANGGVRIAPSIVRATVDESGRQTPVLPAATDRIVREDVAAQVRLMLEGVVSDEGTGPLAAVPGYRIAGKTGTAQRVVDGRYAPGNYSSSFVGFAPADAPRVVTAVVLQGTRPPLHYGGAVAGPVFRDVTAFALRSLEVPPTGTAFVMPRLRAD